VTETQYEAAAVLTALAGKLKPLKWFVSWPTNQVGFTLQYSDGLNPPNWIDCTNSPAVVGSPFCVTNSILTGAQFFRLKK
jgi:hypothetical protein